MSPDMNCTEQQEYLCQVNDTISCGNCCGLYNVADASFENLNALLRYRTELFSQTPRDMDAILSFKDQIRKKESARHPISDFHHCPYIGFVGNPQKTVGCLLHPSATGNNGIDFRGLSFYGSLTCNMYFCPSAHNLLPEYGKIVKALAEDWYQYGLIITELTLLTSFFEKIERRIKQPVTLKLCLSTPALKQGIVEFFRIKLDWPFRPRQHIYKSNYYFNDNLYPKPEIDYGALNRAPSSHDLVLTEMTSEFKTAEDLTAAERLLDNLFHRMCHFG